MRVAKEKKSDSETIRFIDSVFQCHDGRSWERLNHNLSEALCIAIRGFFSIERGDFILLSTRFRWGYWAGTSSNRFHMGERFYALACQWDTPAAKVFEHDFGRTPFILDGHRLHEHSKFWANGRHWRISGWGEGNSTINIVGYNDSREFGHRKQHCLTRKEWLDFRKGAKAA